MFCFITYHPYLINISLTLFVLQHRPYNASLSYSSSCVSGSEFFDAEELLIDKQDHEGQVVDLEAEVQTRGSDSSSEAGSLSSGEGSISSESELGVEFNQANNDIEIEGIERLIELIN